MTRQGDSHTVERSGRDRQGDSRTVERSGKDGQGGHWTVERAPAACLTSHPGLSEVPGAVRFSSRGKKWSLATANPIGYCPGHSCLFRRQGGNQR